MEEDLPRADDMESIRRWLLAALMGGGLLAILFISVGCKPG